MEKIKKIKIKKNNDLSTNGYIENEYGTRCVLTASNRLTIEKLNEVINTINELINNTSENQKELKEMSKEVYKTEDFFIKHHLI